MLLRYDLKVLCEHFLFPLQRHIEKPLDARLPLETFPGRENTLRDTSETVYRTIALEPRVKLVHWTRRAGADGNPCL